MKGSDVLGNCLIINSYSYKNAGDAAIMLASARLLTGLGASRVALSSRYDDADAYRAHGVPLIPELIRFPVRGPANGASRVGTVLVAFFAALVVVSAGAVNRRLGRLAMKLLSPGAYETLLPVDTLVIAGGGYMYSSRRRVNLSLWHSLLSIRFAQVAVPRTVMMPQSVGPVHSTLDAKLIEIAMAKNSVVIRERASLAASTVPVRLTDPTVIDDVAFYGAFDDFDDFDATAGRAGIRVVVMDWRWSNSADPLAFDSYVTKVAEVVDGLVEDGHAVSIGGHSSLPEHDQDDIEVARMVLAACVTNVATVDEDTDVAHLDRVYRRSRLVIGTRLHACIMAIAVGTPAISLAYQEKSKGVLANIGYAERAFLVSDFVTVDVLDLARALLIDSEDAGPTAVRIRTGILESYRKVIA